MQPYLTYKLDLIKSQATQAADQAYAAELDLRVRELRVLRPVHEHPGISATELRRLLVLDKTLMSKNLALLEQRGLIRREVHEADNRFQRLYLTEEGERAWRVSERLGRQMEADMFGELTPEQWQQLHGLLDAVLASFDHWRSRREAQAGDAESRPADRKAQP
jgi:DNA-binding MarR family transcriptional regulator